MLVEGGIVLGDGHGLEWQGDCSWWLLRTFMKAVNALSNEVDIVTLGTNKIKYVHRCFILLIKYTPSENPETLAVLST